jgi:iron complex outermembrane receptor protein
MKRISIRLILAATVVAATPLSSLVWAQAAATPPAPQAGGDLDEIVITARQREEKLIDVPATVQAFTAADLKSAGIERPQDFIALTPGVSQVQTAEIGDMQVNIRGISTGRDAETNFALVIDGVLQTNPNAFNQELAGVTQIEVLKGPQGALYGRNALAGAIIISTKKPGDVFEGQFKAGAGNNNQYTGSFNVSGPLASGVGGSLGAYTRQDNGSFYNSYLRCDNCGNYLRDTGATGRLIFKTSDSAEFDLKAKYSEVKAGAINFNASIALKDAAVGSGFGPLWEDPNAHDFLYINNVKPVNEQKNLNLSVKGSFNVPVGTLTATAAYNDQKNYFLTDGTSDAFQLYSANTTCQASFAARAADTPVGPPFNYGTPSGNMLNAFPPPYSATTCGGYQYQQRDQKDSSLEVRLASPGNQQLRWLTGVYFADIKRHVVVAQGGDLGLGFLHQAFVPSTGPNPTDLLYDDDFRSKVYAAFGSVAYDLRPGLELALALRYDREERDVDNNVPKVSPQTPGFGPFGLLAIAVPAYQAFGFGPVCPSGPNLPDCKGYINPFYNLPANAGLSSIPSRSKSFDQFQPKVSVNWKPNEEWAWYASYGYGFRSGGFNSSGSAATLNQFFGGLKLDDGTPNLQNVTDDFRKEVSKAAEVGFKSRLLDRRLSLNAALYYTQVDDMQNFSFFAGPFGLLRIVTNIDKVDIQGAEMDFRWHATDYFTLLGGAGYTDTEIKAYAVRPYTKGNKVPYVPEYTGNLGAEFRVPVEGRGLTMVARVDATFLGKTWFSPVQNNRLPNFFTGLGFGEGDFSKQYRKPYSTIDARLGIEGEHWSGTLWGHNVTDKKYLEEIIPAPEFGGSFIHDSYGISYGLEFAYRFGK